MNGKSNRRRLSLRESEKGTLQIEYTYIYIWQTSPPMVLVNFFQAAGVFSSGNAKEIALCEVCPEKRSIANLRIGCGKCREFLMDSVVDDGIVEETLERWLRGRFIKQ